MRWTQFGTWIFFILSKFLLPIFDDFSKFRSTPKMWGQICDKIIKILDQKLLLLQPILLHHGANPKTQILDTYPNNPNNPNFGYPNPSLSQFLLRRHDGCCKISAFIELFLQSIVHHNHWRPSFCLLLTLPFYMCIIIFFFRLSKVILIKFMMFRDVILPIRTRGFYYLFSPN